MEEPISDVEAYHNSLLWLANVIRDIALEADSRREGLVGVNLTGEFHWDAIGSVDPVLLSPANDLNEDQNGAIRQFRKALQQLPREALQDTVAQQGFVSVMAHPEWRAVREQATLLLRRLEPALLRAQRYFEQ